MDLFIALLIILIALVLFLKVIYFLFGAFTIELIYPKSTVDVFLQDNGYSYVSHQNVNKKKASKDFDLSFITSSDKMFFRIFYYELRIKTNTNEMEELLIVCLRTFSFFVKGRLLILSANKIILDQQV